MKIGVAATATLWATQWFVTTTTAAPIETCAAQSECVQFTVHKVDNDQVCNCDCFYNICMTLSFAGSCAKTDTVSHTCEKDSMGCSNATGFTDATEVKSIGDGYTTCQKVPAGGTAEFLLKDGNTKDGCGTQSLSFQSDYTANCETYGVKSCTGNGNVGKECIWTIAAPNTCNKKGGCFGDPHIKRWDQKRFDFHGECDLVLLHSNHVNGDVPLDLHLRTKIQGHYSYIESAALKVGETVFQLDADKYFVNGVEYTDDSSLPMFLDEFVIEAVQREATYKVYTVVLTDLSTIKFKVIKNFISVAVSGHEDDFADSVGLLGDYSTGNPLGRDDRPLTDFVKFGMEWQVLAEEPKIFQTNRSPQLPAAKCILPSDAATASRRHLLRSKADTELAVSAQSACVRKEDYESCLEDVLTTGDLSLAEAW